jgi:hypothetical protein
LKPGSIVILRDSKSQGRMSEVGHKQTKCNAAKRSLFDTSGPWRLPHDHWDAELTSIMSCIKLRSASVSKGLRNIGKLGGTACAASL